MLYTFIVLAFGVYVGQEYPLIPSVRILFDRAITYIQEQAQQAQLDQAQAQQQPQNGYFLWRFLRNIGNR